MSDSLWTTRKRVPPLAPYRFRWLKNQKTPPRSAVEKYKSGGKKGNCVGGQGGEFGPFGNVSAFKFAMKGLTSRQREEEEESVERSPRGGAAIINTHRTTKTNAHRNAKPVKSMRSAREEDTKAEERTIHAIRSDLMRDLKAIENKVATKKLLKSNCPFAQYYNFSVGNSTPKAVRYKNTQPSEGGIWMRQSLERKPKGVVPKNYSLRNDQPNSPEVGWYTECRLPYRYVRNDNAHNGGSF